MIIFQRFIFRSKMARHELWFWPPLPTWRSVSKNIWVENLNMPRHELIFWPPPLPHSLIIQDFWNDRVGVSRTSSHAARHAKFSVQLRNLFQKSTAAVFHSVRARHMYYGMLVGPYRASSNCTARRQELLSSACTCMCTECIAALYANQTSQYAM